MAGNICGHCGLTFCSEYDLYSHRIADGCIDVRAETAWHVDNEGRWTLASHGLRKPWETFCPVDEHSVVYRTGRDR